MVKNSKGGKNSKRIARKHVIDRSSITPHHKTLCFLIPRDYYNMRSHSNTL